MSNWRDHPFHALLLLTEKPAGWPALAVWLAPLALAAAVGATWHWAAAGALLALAAADWAMLASLPRRRLSFGAVHPPFLALSVVRGLVTLVAAPLAARWPVPTITALVLFQTGVWVLLWWGTHIEPFRVEVTHVDIVDRRLPNPGRPLRIVQLSDLHVERLTEREHALPALVRRLAPDLLVLTGDYLNTSYNRDAEAAADLATLLDELEAPLGIYAVWGTAHVDYPDILRPVLNGAGVEVLEDRGVAVQQSGNAPHAPVWLMGVTPTWDLDADVETVRAVLSEAPADAFSVLLYHLPDLMPAAAQMGVDLYLAGHTHGGQWRVPGFGALVTSSRHGKRYEAGAYREGGTRLYVSRGLGMEGFGTPRARLFCRPEVVVFDLAGCDGD